MAKCPSCETGQANIHPLTKEPGNCDACRQKARQRTMVRFVEIRKENLTRLKTIAGIPERFLNAVPEDLPAKLRDAMVKAMEEGKGLCLYGASGQGKTHVLCALGHHLLSQGVPVRFYSVPELTALLRKEPNRIDELKMVQHLLLDDLGAEYDSGTGWWAEMLYRILNERYNRNLPTSSTYNSCVTGAFNPDDRIKRRLLDMSHSIELKGRK